MKNSKILSIFLVLALFGGSMPVKAAERAAVAPTQAGPAHPGPRPQFEEGETQGEYGKRIADWERRMIAYEASGPLAQEEEQNEGAARAQEGPGFSVDTPEEGLAAWFARMRKEFPEANASLGQKGLTQIAKKMILPEIEQKSIVLPGGGTDQLALFSNGRYLVGIMAHILQVWDMRRQGRDPLALLFDRRIRDVAVSAVGNRIALLFSNEILLYSLNDQSLSGRSPSSDLLKLDKTLSLSVEKMNYRVMFSPNGRYLATALEGIAGGYASIWDLQNLEDDPKTFKTGVIASFAFSPDSRYFVARTSWNAITFWDIQSLAISKILNRENSEEIIFSPNGRYMASMSRNDVKIWNMRNLSADPITINRDKDSQDFIAMYFSPNSAYLATVGASGDIKVYDIEQRSLKVFSKPFFSGEVLISPDNRYLLSHLPRNMIHIEDIQYPDIRKSLDDRFNSAVFLPNAKYLITASYREVKMWDWRLLTKDMVQQRKKIEQQAKEWFTQKKKQKLPWERWSNWLTRSANDFDFAPGKSDGGQPQQAEEKDEQE